MQTATRVMTHGGPGEFDNGYAGIGGVYRHSDGRLYGFYHAEDWDPSIPPNPSGYPGWYGSVGEAVSDDDGASWQKLGPAVTGSKPKDFSAFPGQSSRGIATPSAVADPSGTYLYVYYGNSITGQPAMARADLRDGPPVPGRFRKYHAGEFTEPGLGGTEDTVLNAGPSAAAIQPHVVYSQHLRRYVMVVHLENLTELVNKTSPAQSGIYLSFSVDGIAWSEPQQLFVDHVLIIAGMPLSWEANILWDDDTGKQGWLVYGHTDKWPDAAGGVDHYMVGRRIEFH